MIIKWKKLDPNAIIPKYATPGSAGFDFYALEDTIIDPDETKIVRTGLSCSIPEGYEMQIRPRSGLSLKSPIRIANSPGTIDSDYRGEIGIIVWNVGNDRIKIEKGMRIAQGIINKVEKFEFVEVEELDETDRDSGGFGSTGVK